MVRSFKNKHLQRFHEKGQVGRINPQHRDRVRRILDMLEVTESLDDLKVPGFMFHKLESKPTRYSMKITGNWRITFEWKNGDVVNVNYEDYH